MIRFGHGKTRVTLAWLAGAALACALIGTCLALLRSDVLPFRDAWPSTHGTRTPVSQLAPPQAASQPGGRPSFAAQPTTIGGAPAIGLPGLSGLPTGTGTGPLAPAAGLRPAGRRPCPAPAHRPRRRQTTTGGGTVGPQGARCPASPPRSRRSRPRRATPAVPAAATPDVAAARPDIPCRRAPPAAPAPRAVRPTPTRPRADDAPPADTTPATGDTPASPVDGDTPAGPANATPSAPATEPTPAPPRRPTAPRRPRPRP